jgi:hypothetical protein
MGLVLVQAIGVGLHDPAIFEKQQPDLAGWHPRNKGGGVIERRAQPPHDVPRVERLARRQSPPFGRQVIRVATNLGDQPLGRKAGQLFDRRQDHGSERQNGLVDRRENDDVARLAPTGCSHNLVYGQIDRAQDIAEDFVMDGRKKATVGVRHPFELRAGAVARYFRGVHQGQLTQP